VGRARLTAKVLFWIIERSIPRSHTSVLIATADTVLWLPALFHKN
jgi:hypothetical protein